MKRTFIAIRIITGINFEELLSDLKSELKDESVRWVDPGNMHLTLAFLGDTADDILKRVSSMLISRCGDFGEFEFAVTGLGVFRNPDDPRIIWAGIEKNERFMELFQLISSELYELGIKTEQRQFKPHLTVGRVRSLKNNDKLKALLKKYEGKTFQKANVSEIVYYESILQQTGPLYIPILAVELRSH
jgi:2'-5' RNA ligase